MIDKSGAWYSYQGTRIGQGKENVGEYLREHPEMAKEIEAKIRAHFFAATKAVAATPESEEE